MLIPRAGKDEGWSWGPKLRSIENKKSTNHNKPFKLYEQKWMVASSEIQDMHFVIF